MQKITIFAFGSRGDVQPYIPLGMRLQQEGYQVSLLAGDEFEAFITSYGLGFIPIGFRVRETISESDAARALLESRRGLIRGMQELMQTLQPAVVQMCDSTLKACEQADAVIFSIIVPFAGDQPFWAGRVGQLGVGPTPIPRQRLTAERLADAIHTTITTPAIRQRAAVLGKQIRQEDGIEQAVSIIQEHLHSSLKFL